MRKLIFFFCIACVVCACNRPSKADQYRADKHHRDSVALVDQERTLAYYQLLLDSLQPQADSLLTFFKYEKNDKYQDHGNYVVKNSAFGYAISDLRILVRDDGAEVLVYRNGKRVTSEGVHELKKERKAAVECAQHLQTVIADINELEKRIQKTSLEVQKYQKRLQKE